ncbi:MAG TPA: hypothetical protein ENK05_11375 [Gammaproteobacteria bacterium]|nr:hypothetical protein [Gammaproteobacteria bacterium]
MSYILEALKKAEQQREIGQVPGIDSAHPGARKDGAHPWLWLVAVVLAINAVLLTLLFWPVSDRPAGENTKTQARLPEAAARPAPETPPAPVPVPLDRVTVPGNTGPATPVQRPASASPRVAGPLEDRPDTAGLPSPPLARQQPVRPLGPPTPAPAQSEKRQPSLPVWPRIPAPLFRQLGSALRLDVHVYSDQPQERFVLINLQKYREGERLQEGPRLDEITPEGVILSFHGQRFRVQAQ